MRIALVQMRCEMGAIDENLSQLRIYIYIRDAAAQDVEVVSFPEASITGYVNELERPGSSVSLDGPEVARFLTLAKDGSLIALAGIVERNPEGLLIESLEPESDEGVAQAWVTEIERRVAELDAGVVQTIPWDELRTRLYDGSSASGRR